MAPQQGLPGSGELGKTLEALKQGTETLGTELTALKEEVGSFSGIREDLKGELQQLLSSHFEGLEAKLSTVSTTTEPAAEKPKAAPPTKGKKE